jgi:hypothetical protein
MPDMSDTLPVTIRSFDFATLEWHDVTVPVPDQPSWRARGRRVRKPGQAARRGAPRVLTGLSDGAPLPSWWRDTAFAEIGPLADDRRHIADATMKTHRAPVIAFADPAGPATSAHRRDL